MTNSVIKILDSNKKVVYKLTGNAAESWTIKIDSGSLKGALDANGVILVPGGVRANAYRLYPKKIIYDVKIDDGKGYLSLLWANTTSGGANTVLSTLSGRGTIALNEGGEPFIDPGDTTINKASASSATGNVALQTVGGSGNTAYTIYVDFRKEPTDYDAGQSQDPASFNTGRSAWNGSN